MNTPMTPEQRLDAGDDRMARIEARLTQLETDMRENTVATREILEIVETGKALFKFGGWFAATLKWGAAVAAGLAAVWAVVNGKKL